MAILEIRTGLGRSFCSHFFTSKMTPNIEDVEIVEVGHFYMVPTVIHNVRSPRAHRVVPVIGSLHEDKKFIGFADHHWHPDHRFVTQEWIDSQINSVWAIVLTPIPSKIQHRDVYSATPESPFYVDGGRRRMKCKRLLGSFCEPSGKPPRWINNLEAAYAHEHLRDGHICPHRGISCRGVVAESDGGVVCPGHGLKWNPKTGHMVSRIAQPSLFR